jgi:Ser/Thr protein kinase RdoA (MazF antagonist)
LQQASKIWTHNDLHASNLFWSAPDAKAEITAVIDFGLSDRNSALYDLAVTIERNFIDWLELEQSPHIQIDEAGLTAFLHAYFSEVHPQEDFSILPELLKIVHLDFAFSELEYFVGITHNLNHADAAYYDWIIGHVDWFFGEQGQQFTQTLTRLIQHELQASQCSL